MLIDLHCHTLKAKSGESKKRNVIASLFFEKITKASVKIVAITNHNCFDLEQYNELKEIVKGQCEVWPGVELDVQGKKNAGHLIVISNPKNSVYFDEKIKELIGKDNPDNFKSKLQKIYDTLNCCDVLYIPHFHKEPQLSLEDINELDNLLLDKSRLFKETSDYRSLGVYSNYDYSMIIGSDVQDWNVYEKGKFADLRLPVQTFEQFCLLAKKDKQIINTLLQKKNKVDINVCPYEGIKFNIPIFEDVNIIFGQKGTGKSKIIQSIMEYYKLNDVVYSMYVGAENERNFEKMLNIKNDVLNLEKLGVDNCATQFKDIFIWKESLPSKFKNYIESIETRGNNENKSRMKITNSGFQERVLEDKQLKKAYDVTKEFSKSGFFEYGLKFSSDDKLIEQYIALTNTLMESIYKKKLAEWLNINAVKLTNWSISKIKESADKCSETVSKPGTTGFEDFAINRFKLYESTKNICDELDKKEQVYSDYLGELDGKGEVYIQKRFRFLCKESKKTEFKVGIQRLKIFKNALRDIQENFSNVGVKEPLDVFKEGYNNDEIKDVSKFIGISKNIALSDKREYIPSGGEKGILLLQKLLSEECDVYLLDEPELGMGNSYITYSILPKIEDLVRRKKTVIIVTHNANIAVKTLPYVSIFRTHNNGKYSTYVGNPFCDELENINDSKDILNWTEESMHTLEGGKEAFYERKNIYESGK